MNGTFNRHTYDNVKKQLGHLLENTPRSDVEAELATRGFFNKNWSEQDIMSGVEKAYNELLQNGLDNGNYVVKIKEESVTIVIDKGIFRTAWGHHYFTLEDFGY